MSEFPSGGGEPGMSSDNRVTPEDERGLGRERSRSVEGGADIGGIADPGSISGHVSYVNEPPENLIGRVGGGGGVVPLTEGGDMSVGAVSEGGSDTGPSGGAQAGGAANTGGVGGDMAEGL
ncbi:MAG: hypothetical protein ACK46X_14825 [Candidatus Sericytochromatia bacterium]